jgi:beta-catenin-like protein 1
MLVSKTDIMNWLLDRIQVATHDDNRGYAAELISILLQNESKNRMALANLNGIEVLLKVLSVSWVVICATIDV